MTQSPNQHISQRQSDAHHEAGHAVLAHLVGLPFAWLSIVPDTDSRGRMTIAERDVEAMDYGAVVMLMVAGNLAASRLRGGLYLQPLAGSDEKYARWAVTRFYGGCSEYSKTRFFQDAVWQCGKLILQHWSAISRVAVLLLQRQELTATAVASAIRGDAPKLAAPKPKPKPKPTGARTMQLTNVAPYHDRPSCNAATPRFHRDFDFDLRDSEQPEVKTVGGALSLIPCVKVVYDHTHTPWLT